MVEGFWIVQYEGTKGNGGGVAVFIKNRVFGGDSGSTYTGTYEENGKTLKARVSRVSMKPLTAPCSLASE